MTENDFCDLYLRGEPGWFEREEQMCYLYSTVSRGNTGQLIVAQKSTRLVSAFLRPLPENVFIYGNGGALRSASFYLLKRLPVHRNAVLFGDLSPFEVSRFVHLIVEDSAHSWSWRGVGVALAKTVSANEDASLFGRFVRIPQRRRERTLWRELSMRFRPLLETYFDGAELALLDAGQSIHVEAIFSMLDDVSLERLWPFVGLDSRVSVS